jgi:hypothetical protein
VEVLEIDMVYRTITAEVDVDIELEEFDDDDLLDELERRGLDMNTKFVDGDRMREILEQIWLKRRTNKDYQRELDDLIYFGIGKIL